MSDVILLCLLVAAALVVSIVVWTIKNGISPMPTSPKVKRRLLEILPVVQGRIYELGSGWGTLAFSLSRHYPEAQIIGFETSPVPYWISKLCLNLSSSRNLTFERRDFFNVELKDATMVVCYLYPGAMRKLGEKLIQELKPGALIISHTFALPGWEPKATYEVDDLYRTKIYIYVR